MKVKVFKNEEKQGVTTVTQFDNGHIVITTLVMLDDGDNTANHKIHLSKETALGLYHILHGWYSKDSEEN